MNDSTTNNINVIFVQNLTPANFPLKRRIATSILNKMAR